MLALAVAQHLTPALVVSKRCDSRIAVQIVRKADLPVRVRVLMPAPMAEQGRPYQVGDVLSRPPLPFYRFVTAEQRGCKLSVTYEHGGRGYGRITVRFEHSKAGWQQVALQHQ